MVKVMPENEGVAQATSLNRAETEGTPELVHGRFETVELYAKQFIKLGQIRPGQNGALEELKDSIDQLGKMLNPIDSARLDRDMLDQYIQFTNSVWGGNNAIEDYNIDGMYYLVCAGHSRHESVVQLEEEGRLPEYKMLAKVHQVDSIQDILDLQDAENIHTRPPIERRSFVAVESYLWGVQQGQWSSVKEYAEKRGLSRQKTGLVADAVLYVNLPPTFRDFVFKKKMSYTAGVELARSADVLKENIAHRLVGTTYDEVDDQWLTDEIDAQIMRELVIKTNTITRSRLNSSASVKLLKSWQQELQSGLRTKEEIEAEAAQSQNLGLFDIMATPREMLAEMKRDSQAKITEFMRQYGRTPSSSALELLSLNKAFLDPALAQEVHDDFVQSAQNAAKMVGGTTLHALTLVDDDSLKATA